MVLLQFVLAADAIHENISHLPAGQAAGYSTGSPKIKWTSEDWASHPGAVRICQDAGATDTTADVLDVERYAATTAEVPAWVKAAQENFDKVTRPGQRRPTVYTSANNVLNVANALRSAGITGVKLWLANWNLTEGQSIQDLTEMLDGFEIVGVQYTDKAVFYDSDVFSTRWLADVSAVKPVATRHVADGKEAMTQVAHVAGITVEHIVRVSAAHLDHENLVALAEYLGSGNWRFLGHHGAASVMPKGLVYYLP